MGAHSAAMEANAEKQASSKDCQDRVSIPLSSPSSKEPFFRLGQPLLLLLHLMVLLIFWLAYGVATGLHWLYLCCLASTQEQRWGTAKHLASIWIGTLITAAGGGWCRSNSSSCPGGETMSRSCLWHTQSLEYQVIYTLHYISLAWNGAHWIVDFFHLWRWANELSQCATREDEGDDAMRPLTVLGFLGGEPTDVCNENRLTKYWVILLISVMVITPTWTLIYPWSTDDGLGGLLIVIVAEVLILMLLVDKYWTSLGPV